MAQSMNRWKRGHINTTLNNKRQESGEFLLETYSNVNDNPQVALNFKVGSGRGQGMQREVGIFWKAPSIVLDAIM